MQGVLCRDGTLSRLVLAFSREAGPLTPPEYTGYVQSALVAEAALLDEQVLSHPQARVFVCGYGIAWPGEPRSQTPLTRLSCALWVAMGSSDATAMAAGVHTALTEVLAKRLGTAGAQAELQRMAAERRYVRDIWS